MSAMPDPTRQFPGRFHRDATDTEREAAAAVMPRAGTQRAAVLDALRDAAAGVGGVKGGLTDYELHAVLGIGARPHVPGTRREELIADGWPIVDSGERRVTDTGARAIVWTLREPARELGADPQAGSRSGSDDGRSAGADANVTLPGSAPALFDPDVPTRKPAWA